jgi:addiction module HigA family antidote
MPIAEAARRMGVSRQALHHVMPGQARLTSDVALLFGKLVGMSPDLLASMRAEHDLWESRQKLADRLPQIETVQHAA